ncbi:MAG: non-homologous end-joining DNA ligase [Acidobacteriota bacterium]|nr:non-homologous end-joining DNA ligase [Acidobacteriota bacterium]
MSAPSLFPATEFSKADALAYYKAVSRYLLPHLRNRPISFKRYIDTVRNESFWEKDAPSFTPDWVKRFPVPRREGGPPIEYIVVNDTKTLLWLVSAGGLELHPFLHVIPRIDIATHVVFDLDPGEGADIHDCARVAALLREALHAINLECFAKVSGSKGIQVYVPLNSRATHDATETFARVVAGELARAHPKLIVAQMTKALRRNKVFIDWSQNADYKTTVAVYSLRAKRESPFVSMPVTWEELKRGKPLDFSPEAAIARLKKAGDAFAPVLTLQQKLPGQKAAPRKAPPRILTTEREPVLPKPKSQSGRRLFLVTKTETGNELWMDMRGKFKRWILRPDRNGEGQLIAMPAGEFAIDPAYARAEVPAQWKGRVTIADSGAYEIIEGSFPRGRFDLWFEGKVMQGRWTLEKVVAGRRSWRLVPVVGDRN